MILCFRILVIFVAFQVKNIEPHHDCDQGNNTWTSEGIQGQVGRFPWLGVLRVHLHEGANIRIAVTGAILVKDGYAIANADDVSKIPKKIFREDSKAMFIPADDSPWTCKLKDFIPHPEYEYSTYNTIAIVELELEDGLIPVLPICWPEYMYNASNQLYALGYTDENQLLEKVAYRVQYVPKSICEEFYSRAGLQDHRQLPTHYQCGFPENNTKNCAWDNGMVLAANSSSTWVLIGLGIRGPSCSTPVRFIEMFQYLPWIEQVTDNQLPDYSLRKASLRREEQKIHDIPVHHFFRADNTNKSRDDSIFTNPDRTGWDMYDKAHSEMYDIEHIDKDAIIVTKFKNKYEDEKGDCSKSKNLVYRESTKLMAPEQRGFGSYKLALMDLEVLNYTCVLVKVIAVNNSETFLYFKTTMDVDEPLDILDQTPDFFMKKYPIPPLIPTTPDPNSEPGAKWKPHPYLEPHFVTDIPGRFNDVPNVNLFLTFEFIDEAELTLEVYGSPTLPPTTPSPPRPTRTRLRWKAAKRKPEPTKLRDNVQEARVIETDRNFDVTNIESGSVRAKSFCAMVILFLMLTLDKMLK